MDEFLTDFLVKEKKAGRILLAPLDILLLIGMTVCGVMLRFSVAGYCILPASGVYAAYERGLKLAGYGFDFAIAVLMAILVWQLTAGKKRAFLAYGITFTLPVLVSGSAMWGMGDAIYLFVLLLAFGLLLLGKGEFSLLLLGVGIFLNMHALFLLPVYLLLLYRGKIRLYAFVPPIALGILHFIPVLQRGYPIFVVQRLLLAAREETLLSYNCPNVFALIGPDKFVAEYQVVSWVFAIGFVLMLLAVLAGKEQAGKEQIAQEKLFALSLFFCMFLPYTLAGMHERSLLPACMIAMLYGFVNLRRFYLPIVLVAITYISYSAYLRGESAVPLVAVSFALLALIVHMIYLLRRTYAEG
ncbi:MAG: hypothetical protein J6P60_00255 [Lachnospiraceae bacterium]|nr:hypothetical protein [Lachnospiraceae bacterium]